MKSKEELQETEVKQALGRALANVVHHPAISDCFGPQIELLVWASELSKRPKNTAPPDAAKNGKIIFTS